MIEPKPMDPAQLAHVRRMVEENPMGLTSGQRVALLADRDYRELDAERARVERDGAVERARISLASKDEWMARAVAAARWREQTLAPELFRIAAELGLTHSGDDSPDWLIVLLGRIGEAAIEARGDATRFRARCLVADEDIRAAGLGDPDVCKDCPRLIAWIAAEPGLWLVDGSNDGYDPHGVGHLRHGIWGGGDPRKDPDATLVMECSPMAHDHIINAVARVVGRAPLDVLAEIAAMPAEADNG